jgi:hypothetical protein
MAACVPSVRFSQWPTYPDLSSKISRHVYLSRRDACSAFAQRNLDVAQYPVSVETSRRLLLVFVVDLGEFGIDNIFVSRRRRGAG